MNTWQPPPIPEWHQEPVPTHACAKCGALWRLWRKEETPHATADSWNLRSGSCGQCCDNVPMGDQIQPLTIHRLLQWLQARAAVDAMRQHLLGPSSPMEIN